jgi:predicted RNA-binding protein with PIN domain
VSADLVVLVDGANVQRSEEWTARQAGLDETASQGALLNAIASWGAGAGAAVAVVFDGFGSDREHGGFGLIHAGDESADTVLERRAASLRAAGARYWLVSADRALRQTAGGGAERVLYPAAFIELLESDQAHVPSAPLPESSRTLGETLPDSVREGLERIRRGE